MSVSSGDLATAVNLIHSLLTGAGGNYTVAGVNVIFQNHSTEAYSFGSGSIIHRLADACLKSRVFNVLTLASIHTFTHEMGHAIAHRLLVGTQPTVTILTRTSTGYTQLPPLHEKYRLWYLPFFTFSRPIPISPNRVSLISAAGPVVDMVFSSCQLVTAVALRACIPWPLGVVLGFGGAIWMFGELLYAITSATREDYGDFGCIKANGIRHLMLATMALVTPCALGVFASTSLLMR